jgi:hypothetical protein
MPCAVQWAEEEFQAGRIGIDYILEEEVRRTISDVYILN